MMVILDWHAHVYEHVHWIRRELMKSVRSGGSLSLLYMMGLHGSILVMYRHKAKTAL